jgi:hypothetical protein
MTATKNLEINQGSTFKYDFIFEQENDSTKVYDPIDLTNSSVRMQIRPNHHSSEIILDLTEDGYIYISDPANGVVTIHIPKSITTGLNFVDGVYDIELAFDATPEEDNVIRMVEGKVKLSLEVTR